MREDIAVQPAGLKSKEKQEMTGPWAKGRECQPQGAKESGMLGWIEIALYSPLMLLSVSVVFYSEDP